MTQMTEKKKQIGKTGFALATIFLIGCAVAVFLATYKKSKPPPPPIVEAGGIVRLEGEPLKRVKVRFIPVGDHGTEYDAVGVTDDEGNFTLTCHGQPGACSGENMVLVTESEVPPELRGEKARLEKTKYYEKLGGRPLPSRATSIVDPLLVTVKPDKKTYAINLFRDKEEQ